MAATDLQEVHRRCVACYLLSFLGWNAGYAVTVGSAERLIFGYDSFGNTCGKKNSPIKGASLSGQDMTNRKHVFFLNTCNVDIKNHQINSLSICVSGCPQEQLNGLEELKHFAQYNGSYLCVYSLNVSDYTEPSKAARLCPKLPIPPSKSFPLFNRCVPQSPACYAHFLTILINVVKESDFFQRIIGGIMANKEYIIGLSFFAVVLSFIMVVVFRFIATLLIHIFIALVIFGLLFVSGVLWWLYYDNVNDPNIVLETEKENTKALLGFAITATIISVILMVLTLVMWKRISLMVQLFRIASNLLGSVPLLLFQPVWTLIILALFWMYWVAVLLSLGTAGNAYVTADNLVEYRLLSGIRYMWWYHVIGLIWTSEFLVACQQMTIAGAVMRCYFNRDKNNPPGHPILTSVSRLFNYHLGTVVKGSFIITLVRIPRIVLVYVHSCLKGKESACARCLVKCCTCCLCCLEKWLRFLNQNAYIATAINGTSFCTSAKEAFFLIVNNALNVTTINCFGDFLLFLGKVFVVCFTVFGGLVAFNYNHDLNVWVIPLILVSFFAYLVAHCFLSVFEMVLDVLFMCYAVDLATNDGSAEKPYFMDKELMKFMGKSNQKLKRTSQSDKPNLENNPNTELLPMGTNTA
ncbi:choline transporter-like protein 3 isoform X2 [Carcharodon carcharias]|uniref:choline transporter-like protein 3 isoform X2 n=1 Tax=Carcharodon carcharias TaxID=13397 RepID=UPI001B7EF612|nr:choline transporter-like protein 3 isoform X2 [Carcharodon carcharias]XP_041064341.1 choline transporter-like protein 3 isoform X2 [Carcharodon carcharias]XP_041064342.1 choline transporter-like protein 3 isoform X2 [Carcharodon carcharias]